MKRSTVQWGRWQRLQYEKEICFCQQALEEEQNEYAKALLEKRFAKLQKNIRSMKKYEERQ